MNRVLIAASGWIIGGAFGQLLLLPLGMESMEMFVGLAFGGTAQQILNEVAKKESNNE